MTTEPPDTFAQECARLDERLRAARVTATSPKGIVTVVYTGAGDEAEMKLRPGAVERYESDTMSQFMTAAFTAADRAMAALRQHAFDDVEVGGETLAAARADQEDAASAVADSFGLSHGGAGL